MKNKFILLMFALTVGTLFVNCDKETGFSNESTKDFFKNSSFIEQQEMLKNDQMINKLQILGVEYKVILETSKKNKLTEFHAEISSLVKQLYEKYGAENMETFLNNQKIANTDISNLKINSNCELELDGTVDYSGCEGFWENLIVTIRVGFCPSSLVEELYRCAQAAVCKTC